MPAAAQLLYLGKSQTAGSTDVGGFTYTEYSGFAILAVQPNAAYSNAYDIVRVWFHKDPNGRIEDGAVIIDKTELAVWDETKRAVGEDTNEIDDSVYLQALQRGVPVHVKRERDWFVATTQNLFHVLVPPRVQAQMGQPPARQPVVCGADDVTAAYAFDTWEQVLAAAARGSGRVEACFECKARLPR